MANSICEPIEKQSSRPQFIAGHGKYATNKNGEVLPTITEDEILAMVDEPQSLTKDNAMWFIPSTLQSRVHAEQESDGHFWMLWADLDTSPPQLKIVFGCLIEALGDINLEIYTSRSAKADYPKSRILIPLDKSISGKKFIACQTMLNKIFIANGITPDMRNQCAGQVCYLPNRGEYYDSISNRERDYFDPIGYWGQSIDDMIAQDVEVQATPPSEQAIENAKTVLDLIKAASLYKRALGGGVHDITCPWVDEHTNAKDSGTAFFEPSEKNNNIGGFSCLHEHCSHRKIGKLLGYLEEFTGKRNILSGDARSEFVVPETGEIIQLPITPDEPNDKSDPMETLLKMRITEDILSRIDDARFAYMNLIVQGHLIAICAKANGGKTTIMTHISAEMVKDGYRVLYINADAGAADIKDYALDAQEAGYELLNPDLTNFTAEMVVQTLKKIAQSNNDYSDTVIILDTLKKFSDLMNKAKAKEFNSILRALTAKGVTVIALAHTNKYEGEDGKPIFEGTGDLRNDFDELIYFIPFKNENGSITVTTEADKVRAKIVNCTFSISPDGEVRLLDRIIDTLAIAKEQKMLNDNKEIIDFIAHQTKSLSKSKAELLNLAKEAGIEITRRKLDKLLDLFSLGTALQPQWRAVRAPSNGWRYLRVVNEFMEDE